MSAQDTASLNQAMRDLYSLVGGFGATPPLEVRQDASGVTYRLVDRPEIVLARVTDGTPDANGDYEAIITEYDAFGDDWTDFETIKLHPPNDEVLLFDVRYAAMPDGSNTDGESVYVAVPWPNLEITTYPGGSPDIIPMLRLQVDTSHGLTLAVVGGDPYAARLGITTADLTTWGAVTGDASVIQRWGGTKVLYDPGTYGESTANLILTTAGSAGSPSPGMSGVGLVGQHDTEPDIGASLLFTSVTHDEGVTTYSDEIATLGYSSNTDTLGPFFYLNNIDAVIQGIGMRARSAAKAYPHFFVGTNDGINGTSGGGDTVKGGIITAAGGGAVITIGSSVITGGSSGDILYNDGGVVGGASGGDVSIVAGAPVVTGIQGVTIDATPPTTGQVLAYDGADWIPSDPDAVSLQGEPISATPPTTGQVLTYDGAEWVPDDPAASSSDIPIAMSFMGF